MARGVGVRTARFLNNQHCSNGLSLRKMAEQLWPRRPRRKRDTRRKPWKVSYELAYDGGYSKWTGYYRSRTTAKLFAFHHVHIGSWGGTAVLRKNIESWGK